MAITTLKGHVSRAKDFYDKSSIYFVLGRTETPWGDPDVPVDPKPEDEVTEILGYKKVLSKFLIKPDESGEIIYRGNKWKIVPPDNAMREGARWVYISAIVNDSDLPYKTFRQVGVATSLKPKDNVDAGATSLVPDQVEDAGILEVLDNRKPVARDVDQSEKLSIIIEF